MSRLTDEERAAREAARAAEKEAREKARAAEKQAKKDQKAAEKATEDAKRMQDLLDKTRKMEEDSKKANAAENEARRKKDEALNNRRCEVIERNLSNEEKRDREIERLHNFYDLRTDKRGQVSIELNNYKVIEVLRGLGFYRYDQPDGSFEYVRIRDNKIRLIRNDQEIIDVFENYVRDLPDRTVNMTVGDGELAAEMEKTIYGEMILEKIYKNINYYFSQTLPRLRPRRGVGIEEISTVHDTPDAKYLFYNNVVLRVTKNGTEYIEYADLNDRMAELGEDNGKYIWESNILNRDYHLYENSGEFEMFIQLICGLMNPVMTDEQKKIRVQALQSIIGYLLHDSYECNLKAVLMTDATQDNDSGGSGGTGKGILGKAIAKMLNREDSDRKYIVVPGKGFDEHKDTRYSIGDITTQSIHIEDAEKHLDFEALYNDVADGATFRKLHHDPTVHKAKIMISTNHPFDITSTSTRRRICVFELDNYFNANNTPEDIFKHRFFESKWTKDDWGKFDSFMVRCVETYMQRGLIEPEELNYSENYLKSVLRSEVLAFFRTELQVSIQLRTQNSLSIEKLWQKFTTCKNGQYNDIYRVRNGFTKDIKLYLRVKRIPAGIIRSTEDTIVFYPNKETKLNERI